ncbi:hypothetical protein NUW54_g5553 [Trametes sanguinea]|uniref:Uncharacterized protein n=1 Tax=Trametes sanguinea TaxID=158606 RepID=A0ACC1PWE9_9APHY|nr:hypothetical protein NUW54_g5553 [Trametes sanguinea]
MSGGSSRSDTTTAGPPPAGATSDVGCDTGSGAWNTPLARTENCTQRYGFERKDYLYRYPRLAVESKRVTVGPMPVEEFLNTFLHVSESAMQDMPSPENAFNGIGTINCEKDIYVPLAKALNADKAAARPSRCPGFCFRITANHPDLSNGKIGSTKPDIICYANRHMHAAEAENDDPPVSRANMGFAATCIEIKPNKSDDHYRDPPPGAELGSHVFPLGNTEYSLTKKYDDFLETFGQNSAYAREDRALDPLGSFGSVVTSFDYADPEVVSKVKAASGDSIRLGLDTIGLRDSQRISAEVVAPGGGKVVYILQVIPDATARTDVQRIYTLLYWALGREFSFGPGANHPVRPEDSWNAQCAEGQLVLTGQQWVRASCCVSVVCVEDGWLTAAMGM